VCHDEIDLPVGTVRLKFEGGHGGHNGLRDIIQQLGSRQFYRLRIGVGRPADDQEVVDYVLQAPSNAERDSIEEGLGKALEFMPLLLAGEYQKAMQQLHS
jgi:PTH1 family peptidyl-tRNA hydrolase